MEIIGITGSIGCGKTTLAKICQSESYSVFDTDAAVKRLYLQKSFLDKIRPLFPLVFDGEIFNKRKLRNEVFNNPEKLKILENQIHPLITQKLKQKIKQSVANTPFLFIDNALLFEMGWDKFCSIIIVADVDYEIQKQRVMQRDNISSEDFNKINNIQSKNIDKIKKADIVINTNKTNNRLKCEIINLLEDI